MILIIFKIIVNVVFAPSLEQNIIKRHINKDILKLSNSTQSDSRYALCLNKFEQYVENIS